MVWQAIVYLSSATVKDNSDGRFIVEALNRQLLLPPVKEQTVAAMPTVGFDPRRFNPTYFDDLNIDNTDSNLHIDGAVAKVASLSLNDNSRKVVNWKPESTHKCLRELIACILQTGDVNSLLLSVQNIIPLQDDHGNSLLHIAVSSQNVNLKIIQHLLNVISEDVVNLKNKCKETALHLAVKLNKEKVLKLLLQKGGDPNIPNQDGNNCLHIAAKSDFVLCMKELLHATKCSYFHALNAHNYEGLAPLHVAVMNESLKCVDLLLQAGANVNIIEKKGGQTPLHMAVQTQISVIQLLLKKPEIDVNAEDFRGITPLQLAYVKLNGVENEGCVDTIIKYPAEDLYRGLEILKVLRKQTNEELMKTEDNKNVIERSQSVDSCKEKELCCLLDTNFKWRKLGEVLGMDEGGLQNMQKCCSQPTKMLLMFIKRKYDNYCDTLMKCLHIAELTDAIEILNKSSDNIGN
ncbi:nuclear factor NF-kappa-B p105 subunit-like [Stegodyphus dumicola]|uniref:nuclear factor NF-kappa-B p105 subunit-like n=1 Tax=Stegodyphus dumicola TaxID=202533 RepID=UPI0015AFACAB|nr:nuclear factor NF-kappa-B p105 subunit-like [Stegodyphus dumicola]